MKRRPVQVILLSLLWGIMGGGCSAPNPNIRVHRLDDGRLQVEGPLTGPFNNTEELAAAACELMTRQPGAANGSHGIEYCALHYFSPATGTYFLSFLSDIKEKFNTKDVKTCSMPKALYDMEHQDAVIAGGDHTHPHNRKFSSVDLSGRWHPARIPVGPAGKIIYRELLVFYRERTGECRSYRYTYASRIISALRNGRWVDIGQAYGDYGSVQLFDGLDWLP